jgi:hypothetical protein
VVTPPAPSIGEIIDGDDLDVGALLARGPQKAASHAPEAVDGYSCRHKPFSFVVR